ncbi:Mov34/MPN/PAD-1 family protein [Mesorhizobium sp. SP-1A]|uniref:Mov34/MPN/PAD-1 family protein n=1 Tax=Mesorhizobium sp. SP-1A TaxID=3077840 RepID=UPI0028F6E029|nr:Mov34/MPN/PAD-1 family protein [Mesorhizobium sp. SP-1A]
MFETPDHEYVLVHPHVWSVMQSFVQSASTQAEAGGILIGSYRGSHIEVLSCTTPLPKDVRKRTLFDRIDRGHHDAAFEAWKKSGRTETYVGEWHTHPERNPSPSGLDLRTWRKITKKQSDPVVFIIVGTDAVCAFKGLSNNLHRMPMLSDASTADGFGNIHAP